MRRTITENCTECIHGLMPWGLHYIANPQHAVASEGVDILEDEIVTHIYSSKFVYVVHIVATCVCIMSQWVYSICLKVSIARVVSLPS